MGEGRRWHGGDAGRRSSDTGCDNRRSEPVTGGLRYEAFMAGQRRSGFGVRTGGAPGAGSDVHRQQPAEDPPAVRVPVERLQLRDRRPEDGRAGGDGAGRVWATVPIHRRDEEVQPAIRAEWNGDHPRPRTGGGHVLRSQGVGGEPGVA